MTGRNVFPFALCAAAALAAGCAGAPSRNAAAGVLPQSVAASSGLRPDRRSWMGASTAKQDLLYVSNANGEVTVYRYWKHTLVGVLTNFTKPMGECVDNSGDVFITDYATKHIVEYAHGGTKPIGKYDDSPDSPYTCSVDPTTGNLAVANDDGTSQQGNIAIWTAASAKRTTYTDSRLYNFQGCAYDGNGNLFVSSAYVYKVGTYFAWLPRNGTQLINVNVPGPEPSRTWGTVGGVQWDGKYFAIDEYDVYRLALIHGQVYYVGMTSLEGADLIGPFWIYNNNPSGQGTQVVGGFSGDEGSGVAYWHYPAGGEPIYDLSHGLDDPVGVAVSLKRK